MSKTKMPIIEIFPDVDEKFRFRIKSRNGEVIAQSEIYTTKAKCKQGIKSLNDAMWQYEIGNIEVKEVFI